MNNIKKKWVMKKLIIFLVTTLLLFVSCDTPGDKVIREFEFVDITGATFTASYRIPKNAEVFITDNRGSYYCRWVVGKGFGPDAHGILEEGVIRVKEIRGTTYD